MSNTKKRPENEIYETYWKMTVGLTDIYTEDFKYCLKIIVDYIDANRKDIDEWNNKSGKINKPLYFRGSSLYSNLTNEIINYKGLTSKSKDTTARKIINQYVKIGFINPFLNGYSKYVKQFLTAYSNQEKKVLFSKMFYERASFSSSTTIDNRDFGEVRFLLDTMQFNRYLTKDNIKAIMGTNIVEYPRGYMTKKELDEKLLELENSGFVSRKKYSLDI